MTIRFPDCNFLDNYDYRIWHNTEGDIMKTYKITVDVDGVMKEVYKDALDADTAAQNVLDDLTLGATEYPELVTILNVELNGLTDDVKKQLDDLSKLFGFMGAIV